jgi:hypothetical protein
MLDDRVEAIAEGRVIDPAALLKRLDDDAAFVASVLARRGNDYIASRGAENSDKATAFLDAVKLERDARHLAGAVA